MALITIPLANVTVQESFTLIKADIDDATLTVNTFPLQVESVKNRIISAISMWINETKEGDTFFEKKDEAITIEDVVEALNLYHNSLVSYLQNEGIKGLSITIYDTDLLCGWTADDIIVDDDTLLFEQI